MIIYVADSGSTSHMVNNLKNMTNKKIVKTGNNKTMMGLLRGDWKVYKKINGTFYPVTCTDTSYIPDLSVNIFSGTRALTIEFNVMSEK